MFSRFSEASAFSVADFRPRSSKIIGFVAVRVPGQRRFGGRGLSLAGLIHVQTGEKVEPLRGSMRNSVHFVRFIAAAHYSCFLQLRKLMLFPGMTDYF